MKKIIIAALMSFLSAGAYAGELDLNSSGFYDLSLSRIKATRLELPAPAPEIKAGLKCDHVSGEITKLHLLAEAAKSQLFTYAENEAQFNEFKAMWRPILEKFGMKVTGSEYKDNYGTLKYESPDGRVVRAFMAEKLHYNALDPAEVAKLQHELLEPLEKAGMTPIASFTIKNEIFRPTFNIYYLTQPGENPDHEIRLRQFMNGDDIDFDLVTGAVQIVKKDASFSMAYIGKELGFKSKWSETEDGIRTKLAEYKKFLKENNMEFIGSRITKLDPPYISGNIIINYIVGIYFFR
ncbi:MAG: hypothetical protein A2X28_01820 [Elusimicrobia bacterium GWA2_56_46]|nr:MAG: hypothetical protein A2X28_01820 [Elusimicrobia bacterium GWA2_56_46]OGR53890.1 MAG: hypothetical protein A2X39_07220 [Elusimicrobia bacterium GWC2_56_31]HBW22747.1 hypothetical protein [Elusimicrobiota bacterium]